MTSQGNDRTMEAYMRDVPASKENSLGLGVRI